MEFDSGGRPAEAEGRKFLCMQRFVMTIRYLLGVQNGWIWEGTPCSILGVYEKIRGQEIVEMPAIIHMSKII